MRSITPSTSAAPKSSPAAVSPQTPWHSPVPYLFGGLAAMLGLIAFALLILACSYWKLSSQTQERERESTDLEAGGSNADEDSVTGAGAGVKVYEEKILVIMAGDRKPSFLATPVSAKISSDKNGDVSGKLDNADKDEAETPVKIKEEEA